MHVLCDHKHTYVVVVLLIPNLCMSLKNWPWQFEMDTYIATDHFYSISFSAMCPVLLVHEGKLVTIKDDISILT